MRVHTISDSAVRPATGAPDEHVATFRARVGGYVVDMVIFAAVAMLVLVFAGFLLLWRTNWAEQDPTDPQLYSFVAIMGIGTPLVWTLLNVPLLKARGQTGGQYVAGIRLVTLDATGVTMRQAVTWWFVLNPLLYSWPMGLIAAIPLVALFALLASTLSLFLFALVAFVCIAAPLVAFISGLLDPQNRALHDRIAGTIVVPVPER